MKAIGNYRQAQPAPATQSERRVAQLVSYQGNRATVRFLDGTVYALPSEPLIKLELVPSEMFLLVTEYRGRKVDSVRVERQAEARGAAPERAQPKIMVRSGLKVTTRR